MRRTNEMRERAAKIHLFNYFSIERAANAMCTKCQLNTIYFAVQICANAPVLDAQEGIRHGVRRILRVLRAGDIYRPRR